MNRRMMHPGWWPHLQLVSCLLALFLALSYANEDGAETVGTTTNNTTNESDEVFEDEHVEPSRAVLFPSFSLTIGVVTFLLLSRFAHALPYTAVMFMIGCLMGIGAALGGLEDQLTQSIQIWVPINSQVLLLVFLPGLIFKVRRLDFLNSFLIVSG